MIVSMATEDYLEDLFIMLSSVFLIYPNIKARVYLINVSLFKTRILKSTFPNVEFNNINEDFRVKENNRTSKKKMLVTHLKGRFVYDSIQEEDVVWIDATSLIRKELTEVFKILDFGKIALVKRESDIKKFNFCAEIMGFPKSRKKEIKKYKDECTKSDFWFSDQIALNTIPEKRTDYLEFGKYCNFYFEKKATTWSDRGRSGRGNLTNNDITFTRDKFINEMCKRIPSFRSDFNHFSLIMSRKPRILCFTDDLGWCYNKTVYSVIERLKHLYDFTVINSIVQQRNETRAWRGDLVWARCYSRRTRKLLMERRDLTNITMSSITIGGALLPSRISDQLRFGEKEFAIIVQNNEGKEALRGKTKKPIFLLRNGVDTKRFPYIERPQRMVIGFSGRRDKKCVDFTKGYSEFFVPATKGFKTVIADNTENKYKHEEMPLFFSKIGILVLPTDSEGCSNTIFEAMSSGIPVITTKVGWHGENCEHDKNIIFCERDVNKIRAQILRLLKDMKLYNRIRQNAREFAEENDWDKVAKEYDSVFLEAILKTKSEKR